MKTLEAFRNSRIIVVDEDPVICENLREAIVGWGLQVVAFTACESAFQSLESDRADIIFCDIMLLDACGLEQISRFSEDLKIIVVTGHADKCQAISALEFGAFDLLTKPFQSELLYHSVVRALKAVENERETKRLIDDLCPIADRFPYKERSNNPGNSTATAYCSKHRWKVQEKYP